MKKILFPLVALILFCGCEVKEDKEKNGIERVNSYFYIYVDKSTCLEYFVSDGSYNRGNVSPRYNANGKIRTNKECLEEKQKNSDE